jgi:hypothetical protein
MPVDRRPIRVVSLWNATKLTPVGLNTGWAAPDGPQWLKRQLEQGHAEGYRRWLLILPAGHPPGQLQMPMSQWLPIDAEKRARTVEILRQFRAEHSGGHDPHGRIEIYVYVGWVPHPPDSLRIEDRRGADPMSEIQHVHWMRPTIEGWIMEAGLDGVWFDWASSAPNRANLVVYARALATLGIKVGGEAVPIDRRGGGFDLSEEAFQAPWFALAREMKTWDPDRRWRVDPATTELFVGLSTHGPGFTEQDILDWHARGFGFVVYSAEATPLLHKHGLMRPEPPPRP